jgi:hypothetical protein
MARRNVIAECKLCDERKPICRSHIIPEFAYRPVYDDTGTATELSSPAFRDHPVQTGLWEHLLCRGCEDHFERLETAYRRFWHAPDRFPRPLRKPYLLVEGIDYEATSKFLLSVLWRAHVARHRVLAAIDLGPHAARLKALLRPGSNEPVGDRYPIFGYALRDPTTRELATYLVLSPRRGRHEGRWNYEFALLGCVWRIFVSSPTSAVPLSWRLLPTCAIKMLVIDSTELPSVAKALKLDSQDPRRVV